MHKNYQIFSRKVWWFDSSPPYFLHADSAVLSHSLSKLPEKRSCGGCWLSPTLVCLTQQFACIHWKAENSGTQKTGDTELSWKPNFKIFFPAVKGLYFITLFVCAFIFWRMMSCPLFYFIMKTELLLRSHRVWDELLFGFLKENKIN